MAQPGAATGAAAEDTTDAPATAPTGPRSLDGVRSRLMRAAAEVFAEKGYDGARVQEIAKRAGLTTGAIYANFSGKADLLLEAIAHISPDELDDLIASVEKGTSGLDTIVSMGSALATRTPEEREFLLLETLISARRNPDVRRIVGEHVGAREAMFAALFEASRARGEIEESLDPETLARFCFAFAFGFLVFEAMGFPHPDQAAWAAVVRRLVDSLRVRPEPHQAGDDDATGKEQAAADNDSSE